MERLKRITRLQFLRMYGSSEEELKKQGEVVVPCNCNDPGGCPGWKVVFEGSFEAKSLREAEALSPEGREVFGRLMQLTDDQLDLVEQAVAAVSIAHWCARVCLAYETGKLLARA